MPSAPPCQTYDLDECEVCKFCGALPMAACRYAAANDETVAETADLEPS